MTDIEKNWHPYPEQIQQQINVSDSYRSGELLSEQQQLEILNSFATKLVKESVEIDPEIARAIKGGLWNLI